MWYWSSPFLPKMYIYWTVWSGQAVFCCTTHYVRILCQHCEFWTCNEIGWFQDKIIMTIQQIWKCHVCIVAYLWNQPRQSHSISSNTPPILHCCSSFHYLATNSYNCLGVGGEECEGSIQQSYYELSGYKLSGYKLSGYKLWIPGIPNLWNVDSYSYKQPYTL